MGDKAFKLRRQWKAVTRRARELRMIAKGLLSTDHPVLAHLIPIRRCNLECGYCNEYDDYSKPVPIDTMLHRVDKQRQITPLALRIFAQHFCHQTEIKHQGLSG